MSTVLEKVKASYAGMDVEKIVARAPEFGAGSEIKVYRRKNKIILTVRRGPATIANTEVGGGGV